MRLLTLILSICLTACGHAQVKKVALDVTTGSGFDEVQVITGANSLLGFDANGDPVRITQGTGISISGNVISSTGSGGSATLSGLTDVTLSSPANNQLLRYNSTSARWVNWTPDFQPLNASLTAISERAVTTFGTFSLTMETAEEARLNLELGTIHNVEFASVVANTFTGDGSNLTNISGGNITGLSANHISEGTLGITFGGTGASTASAARLALLPSITGKAGQFLRVNGGATDVEYAALSGYAVTSGTLAQFAATTSAQLAGVLSDETGSSGGFVRAGSPTLTTPNLGTPSALTLTNATGLPLSSGVTGTLPVANGGTGQSTASGARLALLPSLTGNAGKYLRVNAGATDVEYATVSGGGGGSISTPQIAYVSVIGNDGTGTLGDPSKPFATGTAAWSAGQATSQDFVIQFGTGTYSISTGGVATGFLMGIVGAGELVTTVEVETANTSGSSGNVTLFLHHLHCILSVSGTHAPEGANQDGYGAGSVTLEGCATIAINARGGNGDGFQAGGNGGNVYLTGPLRLKTGSAIDCLGGSPGIFGGSTGLNGTLYADGCDIRGTVSVSGAHLGRTSYTSGLYLITDSGGNAVY